MIEKIRYKNFKALRDATLPLERFTLIVGANGTGKTTAMTGLSMAARLIDYKWEDVVSSGVEESPVEISVSFPITTPELITVSLKKQQSESSIKVEFQTDIDTSTPYLKSFLKFNFDSKSIAEPVKIKSNLKIRHDGLNLSGVLDQLRDSEPEKFEELNMELNRWMPEFDRILFETPVDGAKSFLLRTTSGKHKIKAKDLSDGTRLALAYLTIAYLPNPPKIVAFEEPERGIHPRLLRNIQEAMYRLAYPENYGEKREPVQVIATTHSPYLLDLYKDYPEEVVIAGKDESGVHFERLVEQPHYEEVIQDAPLGEIWYTGVLGGVPVQP